MRVLKFGGTSVGQPGRMHKVANIITQDKESKIVVLSAVSGTTNVLVKIGRFLSQGDKESAKKELKKLLTHYRNFIDDLYVSSEFKGKGDAVVQEHFDTIESLIKGKNFSAAEEKILLAQGELISTKLFNWMLQEKEVKASLLPALDFMKLDDEEEPDLNFMKFELEKILDSAEDNQLYITQGFICRNVEGTIDNLKRGGSDYSASLIGAAINADEIQIWTDIDGMHNNDPRVVNKTFPIRNLTFEEAAELAYFGAKILHPSSILPASKFNIPVRLKSTMDEEAPGTLISNKFNGQSIKAIAAKNGITAIKIKSTRMLLAYGFLSNVFKVFDKFKTSIDLITTSEVAVSLTIDDDENIGQIMAELKPFGTISLDTNQTIISIVGSMIAEKTGVVKQVFDALDDIPVRMVSFGGSKNNISICLDTNYKSQALSNLNEGLFDFEKSEAI